MKDHLLKNPSFHYYNSDQNNKRIIICIHGYGQRAEIFKILSNKLSQFAILSIDLPFHGSSNSNHNIHLLWSDLKVYLEKELFHEINLIGYSIGSRLATFFYSQAPQLFKEIYLIAPDGIAKNPIFPIVTHTFVSPFFRFAMSNQKVIHNTLTYLTNMKLIKRSLFQFASKSLGSPQESEKVANTWIALKDTQLENKKLLTILAQHNTKLYLLVGQKDKIITVRKVNDVARKLPNDQIIYFDANHSQVFIESIQWITEKKTSQM
ncbi:alpha/beta fold hydrolase [Flammeovirga sp. OC4]|uniref:alpha/beta fold hydrolase n=1 Tax=Flammeovirga sp. OC4 TaxID=1382345 RepID=UPI0005C71523|nr:alpha/beta hydrolase [Flammeovirga sp. OC4]